MRAIDLSIAFSAMAVAKYTKVAPADQAKCMKAYMAAKKCLTELEGLQAEAEKRLRPERLDELEAKKDNLDAAEQAEMAKLKKTYEEALKLTYKEEAEREVNPEFERISEAAFGQLMASSDLNFAQADMLRELLVVAPSTETNK